ncbi:uncharacterized protein LOC134680637 [Mytilus trossulus]|uniref:uncharacterized protein LOC134680637 n=1 Tax=Mytilus trossulus TaxID=6551 RepID=UPI0030079FB4
MEDCTNESLLLSKTLDALELSEEHVRSKVSMFSRLEVLANAVDYQPDYQNTILTGSIMDGVGWKGYMTDIDTMLRFSYVSLKEKEQNVDDENKDHIFELADENAHSGYTRLRLYKEGPPMENNIFSLTPNGAKSYCCEEEGNFFLSSYKFKTAFNRYQLIPERPAWVMQSSYNYAVSFPDEEEILEHGPSLCFSDETKEEPLHDSVPCFHFHDWPRQATEWKTRLPRSWPIQKDVDLVVSKGCEVVPVGFLGSKTRHLEWRLSFALSERVLLRTFSNIQYKCYALLKMLLKDIIAEEVPKVLSSFHMKNALFWALEKAEIAIWCEERITDAFMTCVNQMLNFIRDGHEPAYFVPENNVLDGRMNADEQRKLVDLFSGFVKEGWKCLLRCKSLTTEPNIKEILQQYTCSKDISTVLQDLHDVDVKSVWFQHDIRLFPRFEDARLEIMTTIAPIVGESLSMTIARHHMTLKRLDDRSVNEFYRKTLKPIKAAIKSSLGFHLFSLNNALLHSNSSNEQTHNYLQAASEFLIEGMESDAAAGKLKYATYLYMTGGTDNCKKMAEEIVANSNRLPAFVPQFLPDRFGPTDKEIEDYEFFVRSNNMTLEERFLSSIHQAVVFMPTESSMSPPAVKFQLQTPLPEPLEYTPWLSWALYDPLVYAYYLLFLCETKNDKTSAAEGALESIEKLLSERLVGYEISALNLLGFSYISINNVEKGVQFLLQAMGKAISPNSTVWQMGSTLSSLLEGPFAKTRMATKIMSLL